MKYTIGALSLCLLFTWASAQNQPLCNIGSMITNETWVMQTAFGVAQGDIEPLECLAGCGLYTFNLTFGAMIRNLIGPTYGAFESCISTGVKANDPCKITDSLVKYIEMGLNLAKAMNFKIPFMDIIEWFIHHRKSKYTVHIPAENVFLAPQEAPGLTTPETETSLPSLTEPLQEQVQLNNKSAATSFIPNLGVLHVCGYLTFLKLTY